MNMGRPHAIKELMSTLKYNDDPHRPESTRVDIHVVHIK